MKNFIFIFSILLTLAITTGCGPRERTVKFNPIDSISEESEDIDSYEETDIGPDLNIVSFIGEKLETNVGYHIIRGTTPKNTNAIKINNYTLSKYNPGQTEWTYIASSDLGTLKKGENSYTVYALNAEGNEIDSQNFTIIYNTPDNLPLVGSSGWVALMISFLISIGYFAFGSEAFRRKLKIRI